MTTVIITAKKSFFDCIRGADACVSSLYNLPHIMGLGFSPFEAACVSAEIQ